MDEPTRVLVVDDEAGLRRFLVKELSARGFTTDSAGSGEEGLKKIGETIYDVVLLDVMMPGMDGLAALREIRREAPAPEVLILTGQGRASTFLTGASGDTSTPSLGTSFLGGGGG